MTTQTKSIDNILINDKIQENILFKDSNLSHTELEDLDVNIIHLLKGELLYRLGDPADSIFLILEGEIDLIKKNNLGKSQASLSAKSFFGHEDCFAESERNSIAIALKDSVIAKITREKIERVLFRHDSIVNNLKGSIINLDSDVSKFEYILKETRDNAQKLAAAFTQKIISETEINPASRQKEARGKLSKNYSTVSYKNETVKNRLISDLDSFISQLQEENHELRALILEAEKNNRELQAEVNELGTQERNLTGMLDERDAQLSDLDNRIVELEFLVEEHKEREAEHVGEIDLLTEQNAEIIALKNELESKLADSKNELEEKSQAISDLGKIKSELIEEIETKNQLINERVDQLNELEVKLAALEEEAEKNEVNLAGLQKELQNKNKQLSNQGNELSETQSKINSLKTELSTKEEESKKFLKEQGELKNKVKEYNDLLKNSHDDHSQLILQKDSQIEEFTAKLSAKDEAYSKLEAENINLKSKLVENTKTKDEKIQELTKLIGSKEEEINNLLAENLDLRNKIENKAEDARSKDDELIIQSNKLSDYEIELQDLKETLNEKLEAIEYSSNKITELTESIKEKDSAINEFENKLDELNSVIKDLQHKNERFEHEIFEKSRASQEVEELTEELKKKNNTIRERENLITKLRSGLSESSDLMNEIESLRNEITSANTTVDNLKHENKNLNEKTRELNAQIEANTETANDLLSVNDKLKKLKSDEEKSKFEIEERDKKIKELEERYEALKLTKSAQIKSINSKKIDFESELKKKNAEIGELKEQIDQLEYLVRVKEITINQQAKELQNLSQQTEEVDEDNEENQIESSAQLDNEFQNEDGISIDEPSDKQMPGKNQADSSNEINANTSRTEEVKPGEDEFDALQPAENYEILSKADLIKSKYTDASKPDENFEYYKYFDIHIVNINLTRVTMDVASALKELMDEIINAEQNKLIVNLTQCEFIDSSILGVLVNSIKKATKVGGDLRLVGLQPEVHQMMELTRMYRIFSSHLTLEEAIASYD